MARLLVAASVLALLACQPAAAAPRATPPATAAGRLAAADQRMWSGAWTSAERDLRRLDTAGDAHALSHLALLLAYEGRFVEAVGAAEEAVRRSPDSDTYARLARALDWSGDIPAALAAAQQAVTSTPTDPLAYSFEAEALADAGRSAEALDVLGRAEAAARTPYQRAEALREWSNYYRDAGRAGEAFDYVQLAQRAQPGFPERSLELANEYFGRGSGGLAAARGVLDGLLTRTSDPAVLSAAGDGAFTAGDAVDSERYYRAALGAAPGDPTAALGLAEVLVAGRKDPAAARDVLTSAVTRHPEAEAVAVYLHELETLVLHQPAPAAPPSPALDSERRGAYQAVNSGRRQVGLPALPADASLAAAAEAHAYYVLFNWGSAGLAGLGVHAEDPSLPGFTGENSAERDRHFGYPGFQSSEVLNHTFTAAAAVEVWVDSVYHRLPILGRESAAVGYGEAEVGTIAVNVMDFGVGAAQSAEPIVYPYQDQSGVPVAFVGNEVPDPAPNGRYPVGYPITIAAGGADSLSITRATVTPAGGAAVSVIVDQPGKLDLDANEAAVLPAAPLTPGVVYTVKVTGELDGRPWTDSWTFQTAS